MSRLLWLLQVLLALTFLFAGSFKVFSPADLLAVLIPLPEAFVRFIGTVLGQNVSGSILPLVLGLLAAFVAYGRIRLAPIKSFPRGRPQLARA